MAHSILLADFSEVLEARFGERLSGVQDIALGLSGGSDSMALAKLLSDWSSHNNDPSIHALIVDHGLREESAEEAEQTKTRVKGWPNIKCKILRWDAKPETAIQEQARHARYDLMAAYCKTHEIETLFLAHHQDDQAETVLFRLAKGSGLDGLGGMREQQELKGLKLLRPLLGFSKEQLVETCKTHGLEYAQDPSNESEAFARVRLRKSMDVLQEEGLSAKRLATTARRLDRARQALEQVTEHAGKSIILDKDTKRCVLDFELLSGQPHEIALRLIVQCFEWFREGANYAPRMEKIEELCEDLLSSEDFRKRTLGGLIFERDDKNNQVIITPEE